MVGEGGLADIGVDEGGLVDVVIAVAMAASRFLRISKGDGRSYDKVRRRSSNPGRAHPFVSVCTQQSFKAESFGMELPASALARRLWLEVGLHDILIVSASGVFSRTWLRTGEISVVEDIARLRRWPESFRCFSCCTNKQVRLAIAPIVTLFGTHIDVFVDPSD